MKAIHGVPAAAALARGMVGWSTAAAAKFDPHRVTSLEARPERLQRATARPPCPLAVRFTTPLRETASREAARRDVECGATPARGDALRA